MVVRQRHSESIGVELSGFCERREGGDGPAGDWIDLWLMISFRASTASACGPALPSASRRGPLSGATALRHPAKPPGPSGLSLPAPMRPVTAKQRSMQFHSLAITPLLSLNLNARSILPALLSHFLRSHATSRSTSRSSSLPSSSLPSSSPSSSSSESIFFGPARLARLAAARFSRRSATSASCPRGSCATARPLWNRKTTGSAVDVAVVGRSRSSKVDGAESGVTRWNASVGEDSLQPKRAGQHFVCFPG